jgi:hypothetical protein
VDQAVERDTGVFNLNEFVVDYERFIIIVVRYMNDKLCAMNCGFSA